MMTVCYDYYAQRFNEFSLCYDTLLLLYLLFIFQRFTVRVVHGTASPARSGNWDRDLISIILMYFLIHLLTYLLPVWDLRLDNVSR